MVLEYAEALDIISRHSNQLVTVSDFSTLTRDVYANAIGTAGLPRGQPAL